MLALLPRLLPTAPDSMDAPAFLSRQPHPDEATKHIALQAVCGSQCRAVAEFGWKPLFIVVCASVVFPLLLFWLCA